MSVDSNSRMIGRGVVAMVAAAGMATSAFAGLITPSGVVAYSIMPAPGTAGAFFGTGNSFGSVAIDGTGEVSFLASGLLAGDVVGTTNTSGYWRGTSTANLTKVVRSADAVSGMPGVSYLTTTGTAGLNFSATRATTGNTFLYGANLSGTGITANINDTAIFIGNQFGQGKLVQRGDAAPGTAGAVFNNSFRGFSAQTTGYNNNGVLAFNSALSLGDTVTANNAGIYTGTAGSLSQVSRKGDTLDAGLTLSAYQFNCKLNANNQVLTDVTLGGVATAADNKASYIYTPGVGNVRVARSGDAAPGTAGAVFSGSQGIGARGFSNAGLMFHSALTGGDVVGTTNNAGFWITSPAGVQSNVVRKGDAAPGTDGTFDGINSSNYALTNGGLSIIQSSLLGGTTNTSNDSGMWAGTAGTLQLIAREGDAAPGTGGAVLGNWLGTTFSSNNAGQIVFTSPLLGGDVVGTTNNSVLYGYTPGYGLTMITRKGDSFEVSPTVFKTISQFTVQSGDNSDGASQGLNENGQIVIQLSFTDGSAALVTSVVPTPGSLAVAAAGCMLLGARRRRR